MTDPAGESESLLRRIQRLEDIEAIKKLKARYLNACDQQNADEVRACFADGNVPIIVGHLGHYETADDFVAMYRTAACHDFVLDMHHGGNAEIDFVTDDHARGLWGLAYRNVNTRDKTLTFVSLIYHDEYRRIDGRWKITATRSEFKTAFHGGYGSGVLEALVAGRTVADPPLPRR